MWRVIDTGSASAEANMRMDKELLETLEDAAILHLYDWERPSATYGYFVDPHKLLNVAKAKALGFDLARRPTGGGVVFHAWDLAFSVLVPETHPAFANNTLDNYAFVNRAVLKAVERFLKTEAPLNLTPADAPALDADCGRFCMARPTKYDVMLNGRKIAGAAQRRMKQGYLHQGTIALTLPDEMLKEVLIDGTRVWEAMHLNTYPLLGTAVGKLQTAREELKTLLKEELT
ncbi:MAG TPA: biotin/lipoate A/B protein ligase family protein [Rhabdochlamydiaceae bacterium]